MPYNQMNNNFPNQFNALPPYYPYANEMNPNVQPLYPSAPPLPEVNETTPNKTVTVNNFNLLLFTNKGKIALVHYLVNNSVCDFKGIIEEVGENCLLICDPKTNRRCLMRLNNIAYIDFDDEIKY